MKDTTRVYLPLGITFRVAAPIAAYINHLERLHLGSLAAVKPPAPVEGEVAGVRAPLHPVRVTGDGGAVEAWYAGPDKHVVEVVSRGHGISGRKHRAAVCLSDVELAELAAVLQARVSP